MGDISLSDAPISHVGIAVANLDDAIARYTAILGHGPDILEEVAEQKVKVAMFAGGSKSPHHLPGRIELVSPTSADSPIAKYIEKRGEGLHHICVLVKDLSGHLVKLKSEGYRLIDETPRIGAGGAKIAFVHPAASGGVLIELEERR